MTEVYKIIKDLIRFFCLICVDLVAFYVCLFIAWFLRVEFFSIFLPDLPVFTYSHYLSLWWIPLIFLSFIFYEGLYDRNLPFWDEVRDLLKALSLASITLMAIVTLGKMGGIVSRIVLLSLWIISVFLFPIFRLWGKKFLYKTGIWKKKVLIIGAGNAGRLVAEGLEREKHMGYEVIGFLDDDEQKIGKTINGKQVFASISAFPRLIREIPVSTAVIAIPSLPASQLSLLTANVQKTISDTMVIPDLKGIALLNTDLLHLFREELFLMNIRNNLKSLPNKLMKKVFDITLSIITLPVVLVVIGVIGLIIKLESSGPAIYAHERIGKNGKLFRCYKFRTMQKDAEERLKEILETNEEIRNEWFNNWKLKDDPRITKVGWFLRRTSLDELPQIFNVLKGQMSLVGPRPYLPREIDSLGDNLQIICSAKPGITGLWQVSGRSDTGYRYRIKLDAWYVMNWSLWLDIAILFKTVKVVIKAEGAY